MSGARPPCALYGKAAGAGDFLRLNLSAELSERLDDWLAAGLSHLADADADWRDGFAGAPDWRFVAAPGAIGPAAMAGVVGPSRDRVGRAFPCILAAALVDMEATAAVACTPWFDRAGQALELARSGVAMDAVIDELASLGAPEEDDLDVLSLRARSTDDGLFLDVRSGPDGRAVTLQAVLEATPLAQGASLWWRHAEGGAKLLMTPALPRRDAFCALFRPAAGGPAEGGR